MVKVYFETTTPAKTATLVAQFDNESTYNICAAALEEYAQKHGFIVTESCDETPDSALNRELLAALEELSALDNCNYDRGTSAFISAWAKARAAIAKAKGE